MSLNQVNYHVKETKPLNLKEAKFKISPNIKEQKRLFRTSLYKLIITVEVNNQVYEFEGYDLNHDLIMQLEKGHSRFLVGAESPFLCGTNWPDSRLSKAVEANNVPVDSLFITDGENVLATIYKDEILILIN